MKIIRHERGNMSTVVYLENDAGELVAHAILDGILEDRQEVWELPDDVDPLDVLFTESYHAPEEMPDPFAPDFAANRDKVLSLVRTHKGKVTGDKDQVRQAAQLPDEESQKMRRRLREEFAASRANLSPEPTSAIKSSQRVNSDIKAIRQGYERLAEERLADDIIQASPELKRVPRVQDGEPVGLTVKFT